MLSTAEKAREVINKHQDLFLMLEDLDKTGKLRKLKYKTRVNFTLDEELFRQFRAYCQRNKQEMSPLVEELIRKYLRERKHRLLNLHNLY